VRCATCSHGQPYLGVDSASRVIHSCAAWGGGGSPARRTCGDRVGGRLFGLGTRRCRGVVVETKFCMSPPHRRRSFGGSECGRPISSRRRRRRAAAGDTRSRHDWPRGTGGEGEPRGSALYRGAPSTPVCGALTPADHGLPRRAAACTPPPRPQPADAKTTTAAANERRPRWCNPANPPTRPGDPGRPAGETSADAAHRL